MCTVPDSTGRGRVSSEIHVPASPNVERLGSVSIHIAVGVRRHRRVQKRIRSLRPPLRCLPGGTEMKKKKFVLAGAAGIL